MTEKDLNTVLIRIATDTKFVGQLMENFPQAIQQNGYVLDEAEMSEVRTAFDRSGAPTGPSSPQPDLLLPPFFSSAPPRPIDPDVKARQKEMGDFTLSLLKGTLNNAKLTYQLITLMNAIMFSMGVGLFLFAAIYGALSRNLIFTAAFAGLGAASFITLFMLGPIDKTQDALSNLIQAEVAFMNFYDQMCLSRHMPNALRRERTSPAFQTSNAPARCSSNAPRKPSTCCRPTIENRPTKNGAKQDRDRASKGRRTPAAASADARQGAEQTSSTDT